MKAIAFLLFAAGIVHAELPLVRIFIEPQAGFESYISAAIIKKSVPVG